MEAKAQKLAEEARQREAVVKAKALAAEEARRKAQEEKARVQRMEIEAREKHQAAVALQSVHRRNVAKATAARKRNVAPIPQIQQLRPAAMRRQGSCPTASISAPTAGQRSLSAPPH